MLAATTYLDSMTVRHLRRSLEDPELLESAPILTATKVDMGADESWRGSQYADAVFLGARGRQPRGDHTVCRQINTDYRWVCLLMVHKK